MIQVLGRNNSINVQKVMWCAAELGLDVERVDMGGEFGGIETPEFLSLNPNRQIPVLIDGDFTIWESNAIVRYLCLQYDTATWVPSCAKQQGLAHQWMDWSLTSLHAAVSTVFLQLIRTPVAERDPQLLADAHDRSVKLLSMIDAQLEGKKFLLGDHICMADIPIGCAAYRWHALEIDRPELKNLERWYKRLSERLAFRSQVMRPLT